ncbi:unnamed protein product [Caenorhabditis brenneri]
MGIPQLYYFTIRGFGEYIRLLFLDNDIKFEDIRYDFNSKEWEDMKKTMIFGQMPCLKMDGKEYVQAGAIMRHLGKVHNLNGSNEDEAFFLDMFNECVRDLRLKFAFFIYKDTETHDQIANKTLPEFLGKLEKLFKEHPGDFIIGNKISYADYFLFEELDVYHTFDKTILDKFPDLKEFWERMWNRPHLKAYLEQRKKDKVWTHLVEKGSNY